MAILFFNFRSFGFSPECLGQHKGAADLGNLGDGNGLGRSLLHIYSVVFLLHILYCQQCPRSLRSVGIMEIRS